ncbi:MAG TPA: DUF6152 family protein [Caulobacteraceae bacterium]
MRRTFIVATAAACLASWGSAQAHHSGAMFDRARQVTLVGTVKDFSWTNPHSSFALDVMKPDGSTELWAVEMNSPNNLVHEGWTRYTLKPGDKVTAVINPLRDGKPGGVYVGVTLSDGKVLGTGAGPR